MDSTREMPLTNDSVTNESVINDHVINGSVINDHVINEIVINDHVINGPIQPIINEIKSKKKFKNIMTQLLKPPPKEDKPNIHLGGGQFSKLEKI